MKTLKYIVRLIKSLSIWFLSILSIAFIALFIRLLIAPIDLTWVKGYVKESKRVKTVSKLELSLIHTKLRLVITFKVPELGKRQAPFKIYITPKWIDLLKGKLHFLKVELKTNKLDLIYFQQGKLKEEKTKRPTTYQHDWEGIFKTLMTMVPKLAETKYMQFTLVIPDLIVGKVGPKKELIHLKNVVFNVKYEDQKKQGLGFYFYLKSPLILKNNYMFPNRPLKISEFKANLDIQKDKILLNIHNINIDKNIFKVKACLDILKNKLLLDATLESTEDFNVQYLKQIWPDIVAKGAHNWVSKNLKKGMIQGVLGNLKFSIDDKEQVLDLLLEGHFKFIDGVISYLGDLPLIQGLQADVVFSEKDLRIYIKKGKIGSVDLTKGKVRIYDLDKDIQNIKIEASMGGKLPDFLKIINKTPLNYIDKVGFDIDRVTGQTEMDLVFDFLLLKDLMFKDISLYIKGSMHGLVISKFPKDLPYDLREADIEYTITEKELRMHGKGIIENINATIELNSNFDDSVDIMNQLTIKGKGPLSLANKFNVDVSRFVSSTEPTDFKILYEEYIKADSTLKITVNAKPLKVRLPWISFIKPAKEEAVFKGTIVFVKEKPLFFRDVYFKGKEKGKEFKFQGNMKFDDEGFLENLEIYDTSYANNKIKRSFITRSEKNKWLVKIDAKTLDFTPYWQYYIIHNKNLVDNNSSETSLNLKIKSEAVTINSPKEPLNKTYLNFVMEKGVPQSFDFYTTFLKEEKVEAKGNAEINYKFNSLAKKEAGKDYGEDKKVKPKGILTVKAKEAGYLLKLLGLMDKAAGGNLRLDAELSIEGLWSGKAELTDFRILKAPIMARMLSVASLVGILDLLNNEEGLSFSSLNIDFKYKDSVLDISKAIASSISIGISTQGQVRFMPKRVIKMKGTLTPMNFINGTISYIPIIGYILGGGEGEGVFSFTFNVKGDLDNPEIDVNAASILAPGIFRTILTDL